VLRELRVQNLAGRLAAREASDAAHPAEYGLTPPPLLLPDHPASRRVTMQVKVGAECWQWHYWLHSKTRQPVSNSFVPEGLTNPAGASVPSLTS
jgi:hypothetical protein